MNPKNKWGNCMKGRIYTEQKCHLCQQKKDRGTLKHVEGRGYLQCPIHKKIKWAGNCIVRFGRNHTKRFKTVDKGERHLNYIRVQTDIGTYDRREWAKNQPLSFLSLRQKFVRYKKGEDLSPKQIRHIEHVLEEAGKKWDHQLIMNIDETDIDDFLLELKNLIANSTRAKWRSVLHDFWKWVVRREKRRSRMEMPDFPEISFKNRFRTIVSMEDQNKILDELWEITKDVNPRIWLGVKLLSLFSKPRPGEMRDVKEGHINTQQGWIFFPDPKEGDKGKFIHLALEDCKMIEEIRGPKGIPDLYFFRHLKRRSGVQVGMQFGPKLFKKWWDKACKNVGIVGVDLYGGTRHSTVTALGKLMTPEQIQRGQTGHASPAFKRYMLPDINEARIARQAVSKIQNPSEQHPNNIFDLIKLTNQLK